MLNFVDENIPLRIRKSVSSNKYQKNVDHILKGISSCTLPGVEMMG
jgi:hypothetical protein